MRISPEYITKLPPKGIFVYGSNVAGRHGKGAALIAHKKFGATYGRCHGMDNSSYGIPTKDSNLSVLSLERIKKYVDNFIIDTKTNPDYTFYVTAIGTGLAGYTPEQIAPLFSECIELQNVYLPLQFYQIICENGLLQK